MKCLPFLFCLILAGCVLPSDIESLRIAQDTLRQNIAGNEDAIEDFNDEVSEVARVATERTENAIRIMQGLADGSVSPTEGVAALATAAATIYAAITVQRNRSRKKEIAKLRS